MQTNLTPQSKTENNRERFENGSPVLSFRYLVLDFTIVYFF